MTSRDFCYWLQGFFEIESKSRNPEKPTLSADQTECIQRHLSMVFKHEIDPSFGADQAALTQIHHQQGRPWGGPDTTLINC